MRPHFSLLLFSTISACPRAIHAVNITLSQAFPQLVNLTPNPPSGRSLILGGQDFDHCCLLAVNASLEVNNGILVGIGSQSFIGSDLETFRKNPFPCGASYSGDQAGAPSVNIPWGWCRKHCGGWQLSRKSKLNQWASPFIGFLVPAVVFCLSIPRRRQLHVPDELFDILFDEANSTLHVLFVATVAAVIVTIDTIIWLMTIFALSGPILISGVYEAYVDRNILAYLHERTWDSRLTMSQRSRLLFAVLIGNLDMLDVPSDDTEENTPLNHLDSLVSKLRAVEINSQPFCRNKPIDPKKAIKKTKTRLRTMLAAQYSFGVTVGAPVLFFCASFIYTLIDNFSNLGDNSISHALAFGMWWMTIPHIAIVSGLLLAGNNPNTLEGIVGRPSAEPPQAIYSLFELVYESRYTPAWMWQRGRSKKIWMERICHEKDTAPKGLKSRISMNILDWVVIGVCAYSLILVPTVLAFLTSFYTPMVGLSCRSMTFLTYLLCQFWLIVLWIWEIESTYLDESGCPHSPVTRKPWVQSSHGSRWQAYVWWPLVVIGGTAAIFTAIGGTTMQILGVYRNCICQLNVSQWLHPQPDTTFIISTNSAEAIQAAATWWKGTGTAAVVFLGFISYIGWWYQRRLRYQFKLLLNAIDRDPESSRRMEQQRSPKSPVSQSGSVHSSWYSSTASSTF